jgi:WXG100 family type VII secretion target
MGTSGSGYNVAEGVIAEAASDISTTKTDLVGDIGQMRNRLESLNESWQGSGGNAFRVAIAEWERTANRVISAMDDFHDALTDSDTEYTTTDSNTQASFNKYANTPLA